MNSERIISYEGNEPYIFISYSHKDTERVMPVLRRIQQDGYRIWYDDGTESGTEWAVTIEQHLVSSSCLIAFLTENYFESENCLDEIEHAKNRGIKVLIIYLEDIKVPGWFEMRHNRTQAVLRSHYDSEERFFERVYSAKILNDSKLDSDIIRMNNLIKSAENGDAESQYNLGLTYSYRYGVEKNTEETLKWFTKSAQNGNAKAQLMLGKMYYLGQEVEENNEEALKWLVKSAENGNAEAQNWLGDCYYYGKCYVEKDYEEAIKWYKMSAQQGNVFSINILKKNNISY